VLSTRRSQSGRTADRRASRNFVNARSACIHAGTAAPDADESRIDDASHAGDDVGSAPAPRSATSAKVVTGTEHPPADAAAAPEHAIAGISRSTNGDNAHDAGCAIDDAWCAARTPPRLVEVARAPASRCWVSPRCSRAIRSGRRHRLQIRAWMSRNPRRRAPPSFRRWRAGRARHVAHTCFNRRDAVERAGIISRLTGHFVALSDRRASQSGALAHGNAAVLVLFALQSSHGARLLWTA